MDAKEYSDLVTEPRGSMVVSCNRNPGEDGYVTVVSPRRHTGEKAGLLQGTG